MSGRFRKLKMRDPGSTKSFQFAPLRLAGSAAARKSSSAIKRSRLTK